VKLTEGDAATRRWGKSGSSDGGTLQREPCYYPPGPHRPAAVSLRKPSLPTKRVVPPRHPLLPSVDAVSVCCVCEVY
jgi:hypothetical protein